MTSRCHRAVRRVFAPFVTVGGPSHVYVAVFAPHSCAAFARSATRELLVEVWNEFAMTHISWPALVPAAVDVTIGVCLAETDPQPRVRFGGATGHLRRRDAPGWRSTL
ncbi:hypothetical protein I6B53_01260 [Schaalia sp. 19OD2882]|uniref:hypothetical protein n=1 Tax=Schaalia sp. 19OD2882 TaxID=2794089 RepID=UPI001C1EB124|nr:hypothetical protein [Schaalia sp. 19OD2882]QWW19791.1 hypothetical protein I6B53_01260 [Schaalia sp. 19OD2882]